MNKLEQRLQSLLSFAENQLNTGLTYEPITGDASFRRYFRLHNGEKSFIGVDAPPQHENNEAFVAICNGFAGQQLCVPEIYAFDLTSGYMVLSDLGDTQLLKILNTENADALYGQSLEALLKIQKCQEFHPWKLPFFDDAFIQTELDRLTEWFLTIHCNLSLTRQETQMLQKAFDLLKENAKEQPQVCVHRDYHSRNLMLQSNGDIAIIDFQDAVIGPITYDLVSLLKDCYIDWPSEQVHSWVRFYYDALRDMQLLNNVSFDQFLRWFDLIGIQRHLKVLGIFARLYHRDEKAQYLKDMPRILNYLVETMNRYPEFNELNAFFINRILQ